MSKAKAKIGVLIPAYNPGDAVRRSLASLLENRTLFHVIIVDDGSEPPVSIGPRTPYPTVEILRNDKNRGLTPTLNIGLRPLLALGVKYVARLDCGDLSAPGRLDRQADFLDRNPEIAAVGSWARFVDPEGRHLYDFTPPTSHRDLLSYLHINNPFVHSSLMFKAEALLAHGLYDDRFETAEDYEIMRRLARNCKVAILPEVLTVYEVTPDGISLRRRRNQLHTRLKIQIKYFEVGHWRAYWGVARTLILMGVPVALLDRIKRRIRRGSSVASTSNSC